MEVKNPLPAQTPQNRKDNISMQTKDKAQAAKAYIESKNFKILLQYL